MAPLFSVVIPTRNRPRTLLRAVSSVAGQSLTDCEVIVVDDASDQPVNLVTPERLNGRLRVIRLTDRRGAGGARNVGIKEATGRLVSFLDDDDEWGPRFLEDTAAVLQPSAEQIAVSWTGVVAVDADGNEGVTREYGRDYASTDELLSEFVFAGIGFGVTYKPSVLAALGGFDERLRFVEDTDLFLRTVEAGWTPVPVAGVHVRVHDHAHGRLTSDANNSRRRRESEWLLARQAVLLARHDRVKSRFVEQLAALSAGERPRWSVV